MRLSDLTEGAASPAASAWLGTAAAGFAVALGIGLLVGLERERVKGTGQRRKAAGIRTFALLALVGASAASMGDAALLVAGVFVIAAMIVSYGRTSAADPGLTTEVAMLATFLLGAMALARPGQAGALAIVVTLLLHSKARLHTFATRLFSGQEVHDLLFLSLSAFVILPLLPDYPVDPWNALNPRRLWMLAVAMMGVTALGYFSLKVLGARAGLAIVGLAGGFVSSTATIAAMGERAKTAQALVPAAASAALMSNVGTIVQLVVVIGTFSLALLQRLAFPLAAAGAVAVAAALIASRRSFARPADMDTFYGKRVFEPLRAFGFAGLLAGVMLVAAWLRSVLGEGSAIWVLGISGLVDVHAAAASAAQLESAASLSPMQAEYGLLAAFGANSLLKCLMAWFKGGSAYALRVAPGIALMLAAFAAAVFR
ncbi:MgtC/SapB family protein [Pseudoxanthomonas sacheonensis]|uniref:MgtC/SapB family protein n=1 Tax=Pseudoxanthomonas sacheonensis TaxID=443615 RepID=UPI0013D7E851|nr:DUF4010 domain-containing protein [Pseudoxanthomonas sacheonensis]KAF1710752.1 hypothetical protein CSC73_04010 [Pseudoxanthomonas sacheonensis]